MEETRLVGRQGGTICTRAEKKIVPRKNWTMKKKIDPKKKKKISTLTHILTSITILTITNTSKKAKHFAEPVFESQKIAEKVCKS